MTWDLIYIIGIVAFAFSGAIVALQEKYDFFGVYILGLSVSFGGGIMRNVLLGVPVKPVWEQGYLLYTVLIAITIIYFMPKNWLKSWNKWNDFFDAIGLAAFCIQGAMFAIELNFPIGGVIVASVTTGVGGGVLRDILAKRKPMVFHQEVYALWGIIIGLVLGYGWISIHNETQLLLLFIFVTGLRIVSFRYKWHLHFRSPENNTGLLVDSNWKRKDTTTDTPIGGN